MLISTAMIDALLSGMPPAELTVRVPPVGLIVRASTDALAFDDTDVAAALKFVRERACGSINASDVVASVAISRRTLEPRFRRAVGHTIYQEITRCRIERAKLLLSQGDWSVARIAGECGYTAPKQLSIAFRRCTKMTPSAYRANWQSNSSLG